MSCCCSTGYCTTRNYSASGGAQWQAPGLDQLGAERTDIAVDANGYAYTTSGGIEKLDPTGTRVYLTDNDGRFGRQTLRCIAVTPDGTIGYVGSRHTPPGSFSLGYSGSNVYKVDLSDGSVIDEDSVGGSTVTIEDACLDDAGGVYFATSEGIVHFDSDFARLDDVGCATTVAALALDDSGNLWAAGGHCTTTVLGCPVDWTVRKYSAAGALLDGHTFPNPTAIAWRAGKVYLGFQGASPVGSGELPTPCNVVAFDDVTFDCDWLDRIGPEGTTPQRVEDLAVTDDALYAVAGKYLYALDLADGTRDWCRKNEGSEGDPPEKKSGALRAVAASSGGGSGLAAAVWATGRATPCNDAEEDACDSGECEDENCVCECGAAGRRGGTLVRCGCEEVPCVFTSTIESGCEALNGATVHWSRDEGDLVHWTGTFGLENCDGAGNTSGYAFYAAYDCDQAENGGWSITGSVGISNLVITRHWCIDDAPPGATFPGFSGTFDIDAQCCGGDASGCFALGTDCPADDVAFCGCDPVPATIHADISRGAFSTTTTLAWNGTEFYGTFLCGGCTMAVSVQCAAPGIASVSITNIDVGGPCTGCNGSNAGTATSCDPFELSATVIIGDPSGCTACGDPTNWTVHCYE